MVYCGKADFIFYGTLEGKPLLIQPYPHCLLFLHISLSIQSHLPYKEEKYKNKYHKFFGYSLMVPNFFLFLYHKENLLFNSLKKRKKIHFNSNKPKNGNNNHWRIETPLSISLRKNIYLSLIS